MSSMTMEVLNVGTWDRFLRIALGALLLAIGWIAPDGILPIALRVVALYPLVTGLVGWCPIYALLRYGTRSHHHH